MSRDHFGAEARRPLTVDVALTPAFVDPDPARRARTTYVVVDVVRATTTLAVMFAGGCRRVLVASSIAAARSSAAAEPERALLGGEVGGLAPLGFDFGNSPREYAAANLRGRVVIFATSNGTRALRACTGGRAIFAGALRNAAAVARAAVEAAQDLARDLASVGPISATIPADISASGASAASAASEAALPFTEKASDIVVVCSGRGARPAYDDTLCAGYLVQRIAEDAGHHGLEVALGEGAHIARDIARFAVGRPGGLRDSLVASDAGRAVAAAGLEGDLDWCAAIDATAIVPFVASFDDARDLLELLAYPGRAHASS